MDLHAWRVQNFKAFMDSGYVEADGINLLYGTNSSGKSSLLQALLLLRQSLDRSSLVRVRLLDFRGNDTDLGAFSTAARNHDMGSEIGLGIELDLKARYRRESMPERARLDMFFALNSDAEVILSRTEISSSFGTINLNRRDDAFHMDLPSARVMAKMFETHYESLRSASKGVPALSSTDREWLIRTIRNSPLEAEGWIPRWSLSVVGSGRPGRPIGGSLKSLRHIIFQILVEYWLSFADALRFSLYVALDDVIHIGPLRVFPTRVSTGTPGGLGAGARGERTMMHLAQNPGLVKAVNECFATLEIGYKLRVDKPKVQGADGVMGDVAVGVLEDATTGLAVSTADVGFGISQVLPVIVHLMGNRYSTILIEQPEIHLHPKMQSRLADIMVRSVVENHNSLVIETHSESILYRLQRRMREQGSLLPPVRVKYVDQVQGVSRISDMRLQSDGELLEPWPDNFLAERFDDLFGGD